MSYELYAIHDAWFKSLSDGDVDDRAAIKLYERLIMKNPSIKIMVYFTDNRYNISKSYYHNSNIEFCDSFDIEDVKKAKKIGVFAKIKDTMIRDSLVEVLKERNNGYCQGDKIGAYNFPDDTYKPLLDSMTHQFSTDFTNICFPSSFLDVLDPEYKDDYLSYGLLKLIAIGGIIHLPNLIYRLYCPGIGGGPGTNMLTIQKILQPMFPELKDMKIDAEHFQEVNNIILSSVYNIKPVEHIPIIRFLEKARENKNIDINVLKNSLEVMILFANHIYKPKVGVSMFNADTEEFYSLTNMPDGDLLISIDETPPLYDLVAAYCVINDNYISNVKEDIMSFFKD
jgi:hypothetical protein